MDTKKESDNVASNDIQEVVSVSSSLDFISLNLEPKVELPAEILNRIQYICPKFKRVQVNPNKIKRKKKEMIANKF